MALATSSRNVISAETKCGSDVENDTLATSSNHKANVLDDALDTIIYQNSNSDEVNDSYEDDIDYRYSDSEADSIPDIEEQDYIDINQINNLFLNENQLSR
ncbi:hypothetical protein TSAR_014026 [Trichomalopsis sarcophagae]|uniref:Uncharacterized protein n=1 Tax=Trichomalopsis sarcophagae TaxID=543379 RepID=A0A232EEQ2_9HYME|nr:hypothetical protein TSAR_014026 [Trichomalopsis sarcophagae]